MHAQPATATSGPARGSSRTRAAAAINADLIDDLDDKVG